MEFIRRHLHKLDKSSLKRLEDPNRRYRHINVINILHHIFIENLTNVLNWLTMLVATATLLALSFQSLPFHGGRGEDGTPWYAIDFRKGTGLDLATVGGLTIRSWGWVDVRGVAHRQLPIFLLPYPAPFSFWCALLPLFSCFAFAFALAMMITIIFLMFRAIQSTDLVGDLLIPAQCTALCAAGLAFSQIVLLIFGSMGLRPPTLDMDSMGEMADRVLSGEQKGTVKLGVTLGAGLITGWSSLGVCGIWLLIAYGRYTVWNAHLTDTWDRIKKATKVLLREEKRKARRHKKEQQREQEKWEEEGKLLKDE